MEGTLATRGAWCGKCGFDIFCAYFERAPSSKLCVPCFSKTDREARDGYGAEFLFSPDRLMELRKECLKVAAVRGVEWETSTLCERGMRL